MSRGLGPLILVLNDLVMMEDEMMKSQCSLKLGKVVLDRTELNISLKAGTRVGEIALHM